MMTEYLLHTHTQALKGRMANRGDEMGVVRSNEEQWLGLIKCMKGQTSEGLILPLQGFDWV